MKITYQIFELVETERLGRHTVRKNALQSMDACGIQDKYDTFEAAAEAIYNNKQNFSHAQLAILPIINTEWI